MSVSATRREGEKRHRMRLSPTLTSKSVGRTCGDPLDEPLRDKPYKVSKIRSHRKHKAHTYIHTHEEKGFPFSSLFSARPHHAMTVITRINSAFFTMQDRAINSSLSLFAANHLWIMFSAPICKFCTPASLRFPFLSFPISFLCLYVCESRDPVVHKEGEEVSFCQQFSLLFPSPTFVSVWLILSLYASFSPFSFVERNVLRDECFALIFTFSVPKCFAVEAEKHWLGLLCLLKQWGIISTRREEKKEEKAKQQ